MGALARPCDTCAEDLLPAAYLTCGKIAPEHEGVELNVGGSVISAAIREATGVTRQRLHAMYDSLGDPGDVAEACRHTQVCSCNPAQAQQDVLGHACVACYSSASQHSLRMVGVSSRVFLSVYRPTRWQGVRIN